MFLITNNIVISSYFDIITFVFIIICLLYCIIYLFICICYKSNLSFKLHFIICYYCLLIVHLLSLIIIVSLFNHCILLLIIITYFLLFTLLSMISNIKIYLPIYMYISNNQYKHYSYIVLQILVVAACHYNFMFRTVC